MTMRTHVFGEYLHENESIFFNRLACSYGAHEEFFFYQKRDRQSRDTLPLHHKTSYFNSSLIKKIKKIRQERFTVKWSPEHQPEPVALGTKMQLFEIA